MSRQDRIKKIDQVLDELIKNKKWEKNLALEKLKEEWKIVVGKKAADNSKPLYIKNKRLFIEVSSPIWSNELNYTRNKIIKKINEYYDIQIIEDIFFSIKK